MTRRAINLGCGKLVYPLTERPREHYLEPDLFFDPTNDLVWDNVDRNLYPGVNIQCDLFDYPWKGIESNTYDFALASHLVEHIPHHLIIEGKFVPHDPRFQDMWFAFFSELHRIMKPGGRAYIIVPYAWSNSGIADPTHVRYVVPATFGYFDAQTDSDTFIYQMNGQQWNCNLETWPDFMPHEQGLAIAKQRALLEQMDQVADLGPIVLGLGNSNINMICEFVVKMDAIK